MSFFKDTSLQRKLTSVIMLTTVTTLLIAAAALFWVEVSEFRDALSREIASVAEVIGGNSKAALEFDDPKAASQILAILHDDPRIIAAGLYGADGKQFSIYESSSGAGMAPAELTKNDFVARKGELRVVRPILHDGRLVGTVYIAATDQDVYTRLHSYVLIAGVVLFVSSIAAYFLAAFLGNLITRPILSLADTARRVSVHNDYSIRAVRESDDETGMLVNQFNQMLQEIGDKTHQLRASELQLRLITDSLPVLIAYVDAEERYQFNNAAYEQWFGILRSKLKGMSVQEVLGDIEYRRLVPHIKAVLTGKTVIYEALVNYAGRGARYVSTVLVPNTSDSGAVEGYFSLTTDISDRKRAEDDLRVLNEVLEQRVIERTRQLEDSHERLRKSERLASIGTLAAGMAHEIRNPLNSILLIAQVAERKKSKVDPEFGDMLSGISGEAKRCAMIIKNVLLFAKDEKTERLVQDVNEVVKHAVDVAKSYLGEQKADLRLHLDGTPLQSKLNSTELEQVLINLINNASESTSNRVTIEISTVRHDGKVQIKVADNGPGIADEIVTHIFDPFFSTKRRRGNTGLGLSLSHGIISDHGGTMDVDSKVGKGTTFTIELNAEA